MSGLLNYVPLDILGNTVSPIEFARKVRIDSIGDSINSSALNRPARFGRIKIWD